MAKFAVYVETLVSIVDYSKNLKSSDPIGVLDASFPDALLADEARIKFNLASNQKPVFHRIPNIVHHVLEDNKTLCGRDYSYRHYERLNAYVSCKNCLKKEQTKR